MDQVQLEQSNVMNVTLQKSVSTRVLLPPHHCPWFLSSCCKFHDGKSERGGWSPRCDCTAPMWQTVCGLRLVSFTFPPVCQGLLTTLQVALPSSRTSSLLPKLTCLSGLPEKRLVSPNPSPQWLPNTSPLTIPHIPRVPDSAQCLPLLTVPPLAKTFHSH